MTMNNIGSDIRFLIIFLFRDRRNFLILDFIVFKDSVQSNKPDNILGSKQTFFLIISARPLLSADTIYCVNLCLGLQKFNSNLNFSTVRTFETDALLSNNPAAMFQLFRLLHHQILRRKFHEYSKKNLLIVER